MKLMLQSSKVADVPLFDVAHILFIFHTYNKEAPSDDPSIMYRVTFTTQVLRQLFRRVTILNQDALETANKNEMATLVDQVDLIVCFRPVYTPAFGQLINTAASKGKPYIASYDDLVFNVSTFKVSSQWKCKNSTSLVLTRYKKWAEAFYLFDEFIVTTTPLLREILYVKPDAKVRRLKNFLPSDFYAMKLPQRPKAHRKRVGYFGGGLSHAIDVSMIADSIIDLKRDYDFFLPESLRGHVDARLENVVTYYPRLSFLEMLRFQATMNVCVAPLILDRNSACKSAIKFIESALTLTPLIASKTEDLQEFSSSNSLFFAESANDWTTMITTVAQNCPEAVIAETRSRVQEQIPGPLEILMSLGVEQ